MFGEMETSLANQMIGMFGLEPIKWLKGEWTSFFALLLLACWRWTGVNILYFLAGLQSISTDIYEAASIDGASKWQQNKTYRTGIAHRTLLDSLPVQIPDNRKSDILR